MAVEAGPVGDVPVAHGLGQEQLDLGPEQLVAAVTEELAHPLVQLGDPAAGLHAHEGVGGGLQKGRQPVVERHPHGVGHGSRGCGTAIVTSP